MKKTPLYFAIFLLSVFALFFITPNNALAQSDICDLDPGLCDSNNRGSDIDVNDNISDIFTNIILNPGVPFGGGDRVNRIREGIYILDACSGSVITDAVSEGVDQGLEIAVNGVVDLLEDTSLVEKIGQAAEFIEDIPGVGGIVGGLVSGFFGGKKKGPQEVYEPGLRQAMEAAYKKEQCYDALAREAADRILATMSDETRKWVQGIARAGNPRFVTNLGAQLRLRADQAFADFMGDSETFNTICTTYRDGISASLYNDYYRSYYRPSGYSGYIAPRGIWGYGQQTCALEDVLGRGNTDVFLSENFQRGGWNAWFALLEDPGSNPYTAYIDQTEKLSQFIDESRDYELEQLRYGNGYLPELRCEDGSQPSSIGRCADGRYPEVITPGNLVGAIVEKVAIGDYERAIYADEMNEIVSGFADSLFGKIQDPERGLRYAGSGSTPPSSANSLRIAQIRASLVETITNLRDLLAVAQFNRTKGNIGIPISAYYFTMDDVQDLFNEFGSALSPVQACETYDAGEYTGDPDDDRGDVCEPYTLDIGAFQNDEINLSDIYLDLNACGTTQQSTIARASYEELRDSYNTRSLVRDGADYYTYLNLISVVEESIEDAGALLDELDEISGADEEEINDIDTRHRALINSVPNVGDLAGEAVRMLQLVQQISHFRSSITGSCSVLRPTIQISDVEYTDLGEGASPRYASYVDWSYTEIQSTGTCTGEFINKSSGQPATFEGLGGERYQIVYRSDRSSYGGADIRSAVQSSAYGVVLYHDGDYRLTITCPSQPGSGGGPVTGSRDFFGSRGGSDDPDKSGGDEGTGGQ